MERDAWARHLFWAAGLAGRLTPADAEVLAGLLSLPWLDATLAGGGVC